MRVQSISVVLGLGGMWTGAADVSLCTAPRGDFHGHLPGACATDLLVAISSNFSACNPVTPAAHRHTSSKTLPLRSSAGADMPVAGS